jgi:LacI family transcriptional regulator
MSITEIAQAAKVSYSTAWRIVNDQPCRSPQAVKAVRAAISRIGYVPDGRRGRRRKVLDGIRTHNIALLHLRPGSSISTSILSCVQKLLAEQNLNLIFAHVEEMAALPQAVRSGNVDGILGYGEFPAEAETAAMRRIPAVWMMSRENSMSGDAWGDRVKPDNQAIGRLAAERLLAGGHRHLAFFNPTPGRGIYDERGSAFRAVAEVRAESVSMMEAARLMPQQNSYVAMEQAAEQLVAQWRAAEPKPTGLFVPVDRVTLRVYRHLLQHGIRLGPDLQIVSCDNEVELLSLMDPMPESIDLNREAVARLAVERLLWRMKNGVDDPSIVMTVSPMLATTTNR